MRCRLAVRLELAQRADHGPITLRQVVDCCKISAYPIQLAPLPHVPSWSAQADHPWFSADAVVPPLSRRMMEFRGDSNKRRFVLVDAAERKQSCFFTGLLSPRHHPSRSVILLTLRSSPSLELLKNGLLSRVKIFIIIRSWQDCEMVNFLLSWFRFIGDLKFL